MTSDNHENENVKACQQKEHVSWEELDSKLTQDLEQSPVLEFHTACDNGDECAAPSLGR